MLGVLAALGVEQFLVVAFSGGGPYAAALAARVPDRLILAAPGARSCGGELLRSRRCGQTASASPMSRSIAADPDALSGSLPERAPST